MPAEIRRQRMTVEEYHLLPFHPGWKVEYSHGEAVYWPRETCAYGTLPVRLPPVALVSGVALRAPDSTDSAALIEIFRDAFSAAPEYAGWPAERFEEEARKVIADFLAGKRGARSDASRVAVVNTPGADDGAVIGASLVVQRDSQTAMLDVLMVASAWQRRAVATALCAAALTRLAASGGQRLISRWHLANEASVAWHRKIGFLEEPDLFTAQLYLRAAKQELWRLEQLGELHDARREPLLRSSEHWQCEVARLEALLDTGDKAAAFACHRFAG